MRGKGGGVLGEVVREAIRGSNFIDKNEDSFVGRRGGRVTQVVDSKRRSVLLLLLFSFPLSPCPFLLQKFSQGFESILFLFSGKREKRVGNLVEGSMEGRGRDPLNRRSNVSFDHFFDTFFSFRRE